MLLVSCWLELIKRGRCSPRGWSYGSFCVCSRPCSVGAERFVLIRLHRLSFARWLFDDLAVDGSPILGRSRRQLDQELVQVSWSPTRARPVQLGVVQPWMQRLISSTPSSFRLVCLFWGRVWSALAGLDGKHLGSKGILMWLPFWFQSVVWHSGL